MNFLFWTLIVCALARFAETSAGELDDLQVNGSYTDAPLNSSGVLNATEKTPPGGEISENSEFPPNIFTEEQLRHGAVILYLMGAVYSFGVIGIVCGDYFLPSVDCICTGLNLSQDVAAATFMSFATTAPELFIILISTFIKDSEFGVGAVVGSGMFNILGVATIGGLAARTPIKLDWWPLYRDSLVYTLAPIGLAVVLYDSKVTLIESSCLIAYYFFYFLIMYFNRSLRTRVKGWVVKLKNRKIKRKDAAKEKLPPNVPNISLTLDLSKNEEAPEAREGVKEDVEGDDGSFKAYFMNYEDGISLRRISACSNVSNRSNRSNRSRRKSDRSLDLRKSSLLGSAPSQGKLSDSCHFVSTTLIQSDSKTADNMKDSVEDQFFSNPKEEVLSEVGGEPHPVNFFSFPEGNSWHKFTWIALWPAFFVLYHTIPDCRSNRWRRFYPLTFIMCIFWIGVTSYFGTWMISVVGDTLGISDSVMGLTFLALGGSMPEAISTFIMSRQGEGGLGFSNSLGGNTMDICLCLGVPWVIKCAIKGPIEIKSNGLQYNSAALVVGVVVLLSITTHTKFYMNRKMGFVCCIFYFMFIIMSILIETEIIEVNPES